MISHDKFPAATLEITGVKEIGLICLVMMVTGLSLGKGVISAHFHEDGSFCTSKEQHRKLQIGPPRKSAYSFRSQLGNVNPSGPDALRRFRAKSTEHTLDTLGLTISESIAGDGRLSSGA